MSLDNSTVSEDEFESEEIVFVDEKASNANKVVVAEVIDLTDAVESNICEPIMGSDHKGKRNYDDFIFNIIRISYFIFYRHVNKDELVKKEAEAIDQAVVTDAVDVAGGK